MCGIAGISTSINSKINVRALAHELLVGIESRGSDASGFAYLDQDNNYVAYKDAKPGSQLPLSELPRRANTVILHTRLSTQGSARKNGNNHPVLGPEGQVALVHNGVISNDYEFRHEFNGDFKGLPEVDSVVIPALIEQRGVGKAVEALSGYAAIAYLDSRYTMPILTLARLDYSPVQYTWLMDGTFVFASTKLILMEALEKSGLDYGHIFEMDEETLFQINRGVITFASDGYKMQEDDWARRSFGAATSGHAGGSNYGNRHIGGSSNRYGIGSTFGNVEFDDDDYESDVSYSYEFDPSTGMYRVIEGTNMQTGGRAFTTDPDEVAMAYAPETNGPTDEDNILLGYYLELEGYNLEYFDELEELESRLSELAGMQLPDDALLPHITKQNRWVNYVKDMGHIGSKSSMESWFADLSLIDEHENPAVYSLQYVREGITDALIATGDAM